MMRRPVIIPVLLFLALALGCGGGGSSEPVNSIKIESVTPASATAGVSTDLTITVSYDLQTSDSAVIDYCFSDNYFSDRLGDYWIGCPKPITDGSTGITVNRGKGTITIPDTKPFTGANLLYVFLIPNQASDSAVGAAIDVQAVP